MGIYTAQAIHRAPTHAALVKAHTAAMRKKSLLTGLDFPLTPVDTPVAARIDANRWLIDCECGGAGGAHPDWPDARCFGCGRIYTRVRFPANRAAIEAELEKQAYEPMREWYPGDTIADIQKRQAELTAIRTTMRERRRL